MAITPEQKARAEKAKADALRKQFVAGDISKQDIQSGGTSLITSNNNITPNTSTNNKSSTNFVGNDPSSYKITPPTKTETNNNIGGSDIVNKNEINPQDIKTTDEVMFERDVKNMGFDAATEFMSKRNQSFAEEANKMLDKLIKSGKRDVTDQDIYDAISKTVTNYGGQIKPTQDWNNTIQDIRSRMGVGTNIESYVDKLAANEANSYISGTFEEGVQPETFQDKIDSYIKRYGLDIDPNSLNQNINLEDKYNEYINTPEYKEVVKQYTEQTKKLQELNDQQKRLEDSIRKDYSGLSDAQINNIVADRTDEINMQKDTLTREMEQTFNNAEMMRGLGEGRLKAYQDEFTTNLANDWKVLELTKGIAKEDWTKDWDLRQQDFNKNTQKELSQLSILERYDLKNVADNFVDSLNVSDYVKDVLNFRKELDSNLDRKVNMTTDEDGNTIFYDDYGNLVNSISPDGTPEVPANFTNYTPTDNITLEDGIGLLISSNELTDGLKQCGEGVNDWLQEIGAADKNLFLDPISQKNTVINSEIPKVGSVVVFDPTGSARGESQKEKYGFVAGHVAIVTALNTDGSIARIGHWNKNGDKKYTEETLPAGRNKYITGYFDPTKEIKTKEEDYGNDFEYGFDPILDKQLQIYNSTTKTADWDRIESAYKDLGYDRTEFAEMADNWKKYESANAVGNMMDTIDTLRLMVEGSNLSGEELNKLDLGFEPGSMGSGFKRSLSFLGLPGSESRDFKNQFDKVRDTLSLENLAKLKQAGATFGALSDTELEIIGNAASALSKGQSIDMFIDELIKIQESFIREFDGVDPREYSAFYGERKIALQAALSDDINNQAYKNYIDSQNNIEDNEIDSLIK